VETGESTQDAAVRELLEESGLHGKVIRNLETWRSKTTGQAWVFYECHVAQTLPDTWSHFAEDDGGHEFKFFWHPLASEPCEEWHPVFQEALAFLKVRFAGLC